MRCLSAALLVALAVTAVRAETADTLFLNGNIYTVNEKQPHAEAIAIKTDRIVFVGSNTQAERFRGDNTQVIDLQGRAADRSVRDWADVDGRSDYLLKENSHAYVPRDSPSRRCKARSARLNQILTQAPRS